MKLKKNLPLVAVILLLVAIINRMRVTGMMKNKKLSKNFTLNEFVKTATGVENTPNEREIENLQSLCKFTLQPLRDYFQKPIIITSGYRSETVNKLVGGTNDSQHTTGEACDFKITGVSNEEIINTVKLLNLPFDQMIDEQLNGGKWIHISYSNKNRRMILTARKEQGKTTYKLA